MTSNKKPETLSDGDLDKVSGAGDPVPFPDIGSGGASGGTKKVKASSGASVSDSSSSDEAGTDKGVTSGNSMSKAIHNSGASVVLVEGENKNLIINQD